MKLNNYLLSAFVGVAAFAATAQAQSTTFNFTGGMQTFTVPCGVDTIFVQTWGAQGGSGAIGGGGSTGGSGGLGGYAEGWLLVNAGDVLNILVGGQGATPTGGFNGGANGGTVNAGGGGGASDVRVGGTAEVNRVITAGGGGGGGRGACDEGSAAVAGGGGNGSGGGSGLAGTNGYTAPTSGGAAGGGFGGNFGNVQGAFGAKGIGCPSFSGTDGATATTGTGATGGAGQTCCCSSAPSIPGGGGGGGGQLGGGGGGGGSAGTSGCSGNSKGAGGGGGGGSSYVGGVLNGVTNSGIWLGNGQVSISWTSPNPGTVMVSGNNMLCAGGDSTTLSCTIDPNATMYNWTVSGLNLVSGQGTSSILVTSLAAGTYMVTAQAINATCSLNGGIDTSFMVTVNALPTVSANAASGSICIGSTDTLSASGASTYLWNPGAMTTSSVIVAPSASTTYTLVGTDALGCSNSTTVTVTVNNLPTVTLTTTSPVCLADGASTLTGGSPSGGTYSGTGVSAGMFTPANAGIGTHTINYVFTDVNGCTSSDSSSIVVDACLGVSSIIPVGSVGVTPNPATEFVNVSWNADQKVTSITIMDVTGRVVMTEVAANNGTNKQIDVKNLPAGTYTISIDGESGKATQTFVKQ